MISICKYLFEETRDEFRKRIFAQKGFGGGSKVAAPSKVSNSAPE